MPALPKRVSDRLVADVKKVQPILAKSKDVNEFDAVALLDVEAIGSEHKDAHIIFAEAMTCEIVKGDDFAQAGTLNRVSSFDLQSRCMKNSKQLNG